MSLKEKLKGMNLSEATTVLASRNLNFRVISGFDQLLTADYQPTRYNLYVDDNDIVKHIELG